MTAPTGLSELEPLEPVASGLLRLEADAFCSEDVAALWKRWKREAPCG